jgi:hypothetical protein
VITLKATVFTGINLKEALRQRSRCNYIRTATGAVAVLELPKHDIVFFGCVA